MRHVIVSLVLALALAAPAETAGKGRKASRARHAAVNKRGPKFPAVSLYHVNHRETLRYRPYDAKGRFRKSEHQRFNRFMRDGSGKRGRVGKMHPRLASLFYRVARHYVSQGKRIEVVSGYRPAARNSRSPHRKGLAVDFRVKGVSNGALRDYLRKTYSKVGVGYYPNSVFVHFDVRQRSAFWIDYSGPGQDAEYAADPVADLRSGRADTYKPPKPKPGEAEGAPGQAGEDAPPPGVDTKEPPRTAEPAPGESAEGEGAAKTAAAAPVTEKNGPKERAAAGKSAAGKPGAGDAVAATKKSAANQAAPAPSAAERKSASGTTGAAR